MRRRIQPWGLAGRDATGRGAGTLAAICVAYFMVILDTTVLNVALPALARGLHATTSGLEWVLDAYSLAFAALLLSAGSLSDRRGARPVFQAGVGLFAAASLACGSAPSTAVLVGARALQGAGAALAVPASLALLQAAYEDKAARRRALGIWGGVAGVAAGTGPVLGGVLVSSLGWRSVFVVNVPIGAVGLALGARFLPKPARRLRGGDPVGQVAGIVALAAAAGALIQAGSAGWGSPLVIGGIAVAAAGVGAFVLVEQRAKAPMLPLSLFASQAFAAATAVGLLINLGFYGELFVLSLYLQEVRHLSPSLAGMALLPQMAVAVLGSTLSGRAMARRGPRAPMLTGLLVGAAGLAALAVTATARPPYWALVPPLVAAGFGMSFTMPAATAAAIEAAPAERGGLAAGVINAARQVGAAIGVALLGTLVANRATFTTGLQAGVVVAAATFALGAALAAISVGAGSVRP